MHTCQFCGTPFELDRGNVPLGYFARGRCPKCGSLNVIVPGAAVRPPQAVAPAQPDAAARAEDVGVQVDPAADAAAFADDDFGGADVDLDAEE